jgi:hypothetical protein
VNNQAKQFFCVPYAALQANVSPGAIKALLGLLSFRNQQTGQCNPRFETLRERLGGELRRTVYRWLHELQRAGLLEIEPHQGYSNSYVIHKSVFHSVEKPPRVVPMGDVKNDQGGLDKNDQGGLDKNDTRRSSPPYKNRRIRTDEGEQSAFPFESVVPEPVLTKPVEKPRSLFPLFWQCFVNAGVPLNGSDEAEARRAFERYPYEEQERIGKWVIEQLQGPWRSVQFTPSPIRALRSQGWTRVAAERIVPKPPGREDRISAAVDRYYANKARGQG